MLIGDVASELAQSAEAPDYSMWH